LAGGFSERERGENLWGTEFRSEEINRENKTVLHLIPLVYSPDIPGVLEGHIIGGQVGKRSREREEFRGRFRINFEDQREGGEKKRPSPTLLVGLTDKTQQLRIIQIEI